MSDWWAPRKGSLHEGKGTNLTVLMIGPRRYGAPVLIGADGRPRESHPLQYTHAWRRFYRAMPEGNALVIIGNDVWPLSRREVADHLEAAGITRPLPHAYTARVLQRVLHGARPFQQV